MQVPRRSRYVLVVGLFVCSLAVGVAVASASTPMRTPEHAKIVLHASHYGKVIFDSNAKVVYMFGADKHGKSTCYGVCAKAWPPMLTKHAPRMGMGLKRALLGTTTRKNGALQVTYNHHPLYFYEGDMRGTIMCQHVVMNGGIWLVLNANGRPIMTKGTGM